jgi:hypothetical protein
MGFFKAKNLQPAAPKAPQLDLGPLLVQLPANKAKEVEGILVPQFYDTFPDDTEAKWTILGTALQQNGASGKSIFWAKAKADNFNSPDTVFVFAATQDGAAMTVQAVYSPHGDLFSMLCSVQNCVKDLPNPISWA